jgi:hypothetical protein
VDSDTLREEEKEREEEREENLQQTEVFGRRHFCLFLQKL